MTQDKRTHNIVTFAEDDAIVEAVQKRIGSTDYSAAIRFIVREFATHADPNGAILRSLSKSAPSVRPYRRPTRKVEISRIKGVTKGLSTLEAA